MKKVCPKCGTELPAAAKFCMECGTPLVAGLQPALDDFNPRFDELNDGNVAVTIPDENTIAVTLKGETFFLKFVKWEDSRLYIGRTAVSQALWKAIMGDNPSKNQKDTYANYLKSGQ